MVILPIAPSCCGDNGLSCPAPGNEPDASDILSDMATTEPPGDIERAETLDPAKEVTSIIYVDGNVWLNFHYL